MNPDPPACFEPLIERSSQHEVLWGSDGLPGMRGTMHGFAYRFSFSAEPAGHAAWEEEHRVAFHLVMDFPFGFDVRVRLRTARKEKKKGKGPGERPKTGIVGFDDHFEAKAEDADLGRALPWLRDGAFQQVLYDLCKERNEVRMGPDSLHVSGPPRRSSVEEAIAAILAGSWPEVAAVECLATNVPRLKACLRRLSPKEPEVPEPSSAPVSRTPPAGETSPAVPPPTPSAAADAPPEIVFLVDDSPPPATKPPKSDVVMIGFEREPSDRRPPARPPPPASVQPPFVILGGEERRPVLAWGTTWHIERLLQFQGLRRRCPDLSLQLDKDGYPDVQGVIEGFPYVLRVRWSGGKRNLAHASDFSLALEMTCKPGFEAAVYRESWTLKWKTLLGSLQDFKAGRAALDEKYFFSLTGGNKGRFSDLILDAETEPYLDAITDLCGCVRFVHDRLETEATERELPRPKAQYDPFGEGAWPSGHFVDRLVAAAHGLAVRVNGLDTGLIFRRMRTF